MSCLQTYQMKWMILMRSIAKNSRDEAHPYNGRQIASILFFFGLFFCCVLVLSHSWL